MDLYIRLILLLKLFILKNHTTFIIYLNIYFQTIFELFEKKDDIFDIIKPSMTFCYFFKIWKYIEKFK